MAFNASGLPCTAANAPAPLRTLCQLGNAPVVQQLLHPRPALLIVYARLFPAAGPGFALCQQGLDDLLLLPLGQHAGCQPLAGSCQMVFNAASARYQCIGRQPGAALQQGQLEV